MASRVKAKAVEKTLKVLHITTVDGRKKVEVPSDSKVTFGPAIPGPSRDRYGNMSGTAEYAVRIYNGPTEKAGLLAVFTSVREFREESIKVSKFVAAEKGEELWTSDENGFELHRKVKTERKLLDEGQF